MLVDHTGHPVADPKLVDIRLENIAVLGRCHIDSLKSWALALKLLENRRELDHLRTCAQYR